MRIEILGTESLGVRGLCCIVHTLHHHILIDPGVALGYKRAGLLPHPIQVRAGERVRSNIIKKLKIATDVVISHLHGDHIPFANANSYQLSLEPVKELLKKPCLWIKGIDRETAHIADRRRQLLMALNRDAGPCEGQDHGVLRFSKPMDHGLCHTPMGTVMMTRIEDEHDVFVHASDIQLLSDEPIDQILKWQPTILLVSGPPVYRQISNDQIENARKRVKILAGNIPVCILDHHLLRSMSGVQLLDEMKKDTKGRVLCAADFMGRQRLFLEADRSKLYDDFPVPSGWHESHKRQCPDWQKNKDSDEL
ncbi:MAG: hypothetical protein U9N77_10550 [Thermodesulfobacteriota bacterium]|nr:hypothetical protein [Thermodesulfobacteriota bacterium]